MEEPQDVEAPALLPSAATKEDKHGSETVASEEAVAFLSNIVPVELSKCVFADSLVTMPEGGRDLGRFCVPVEFAHRARQPCMLVHAQSQGAIDGSPCGTTVTAYLTADLEVLEEDHHEYVKLDGHILDKRCHMVECDGEMRIDKVTTDGKVSYNQSETKGELRIRMCLRNNR
ncbi:ciliogenesis-associated TTC17-interacting protein-like [Vanacampus margaritifer]